jgi:CRP-like cAMP-binding protein
MPKTLIDYFIKLSKKPDRWEDVVSLFTLQDFKREHYLCNKNDFPKNIYFIKSGVIRGFFTNEKGFEYNKLLFTDNHLAASLTALSNGEPSKISLQCLTDCSIYVADYFDFIQLVESDLELSNLYLKTFHFLYKDLEQSEIDKVLLKAKDRYLKLLNQFPDIENKIMLYHIASHLGVTAIQLSRIRKELSTNV